MTDTPLREQILGILGEHDFLMHKVRWTDERMSEELLALFDQESTRRLTTVLEGLRKKHSARCIYCVDHSDCPDGWEIDAAIAKLEVK